MPRLAIIQNADEPQVLSTAEMLRAAGYDRVMVCGGRLVRELMRIGCTRVFETWQMERLGYDPLPPEIEPATVEDVDRCDLFCEVEPGNLPLILKRWPRLERRLAWLRVNGGQPSSPEEIRPPVPVITACLWYGTDRYLSLTGPDPMDAPGAPDEPVTLDQLKQWSRGAHHVGRHCPSMRAYVCWPPYPRMGEYLATDRTGLTDFAPPYGLAHRVREWGYGEFVSEVRDMGVRLFGHGAPAGTIPHRDVAGIAARALAFVHLKSVNCPGWALYEAMLSGCPVVVGRLFNGRCLAYPLLEHGVTCLEFGRPAPLDRGRGPIDNAACLADIRAALERLRDPAINRKIGEAGRERLLSLMWSKDNPEHVESFRSFCTENFA